MKIIPLLILPLLLCSCVEGDGERFARALNRPAYVAPYYGPYGNNAYLNAAHPYGQQSPFAPGSYNNPVYVKARPF